MTPSEGATRGAPRLTPARKRKPKAPLLDTVLKSLDNSKAEQAATISLKGKSSIGDYMIVASGRSQRHVGSIAERLLGDLKQAGFGRMHAEGMPGCDWVLIDAGDVIVHIFRPEVRGFYNLEKMWSAAQPAERIAM